MKQQNSERTSEQGRIPLVVVEGRRMIRRSAKRAGVVANRVVRKSRRIVGKKVHQTELLARRNVWASLGSALCTGMAVGFLATWLYYRD